ncbi:N-carbamoyl-L-amino acid hydrolase [Sporomusa ovata DSM 2662]|uniref:N-carbamoyl-L-amino acid hydrolase n=1 Tax=Sporomusa ovata TaxID=2378 RepID=A0A0U1KVM2_9FIRM|nr:M20 family metallo-hydrolase [Sporomusa ovata]EQB26632.1 N-carbamoyl-L-amino acid hydrolase [Sporomusa ovata DSM 2662]CQR70724.1 N-carbamoyl-L-amino acid hydrolase [Sporomusa ovata]
MVCSKRLEENFRKLAAIGAQADGGITRLAFSDTDWEAREFIIELMKQAGLVVRIDAFGNLIGRREGTNNAAPVVMLGSHIDSVPNGGNFDGVLGVLAAIEVIQCLEAAGTQTYHPIEVVVFMAEESSRFGMATMGSKAFCGELLPAQLEQLIDNQGMTLAEAMRQRGLDPEQVAAARYTGAIKAFFELHIEQGTVLENAGEQIGIITGIAAPTRFKVVITGQADHSGATPMNMRQDALTAAAEIVLLVEKLAGLEAHNGTVGTVGMITAEPGVMNVIPGRVELGIDIRGIIATSKQQVIQELTAGLGEIKKRRGVAITSSILTDEKPVEISREIVEFLQGIAKAGQYTSRLMPSSAGHDAMHLAGIAPAGMLFIPCKDGISHNPAEWANIRDITAGTQVLFMAVSKLAAQEGPKP